MSGWLDREVLCCPHCVLRQFMTANGDCRRCKKPLVIAEAVINPTVEESLPVVSKFSRRDLGNALGAVFRVCRLSGERSQFQLSKRIGCPRTYVSRLEGGIMLPKVHNLLKFCIALETTPHLVLLMAESLMEDEVQN